MSGPSENAVTAFNETLTEYGNTPGGRSRALDAASQIIRADVIAEVVEALRTGRVGTRLARPHETYAEFIERELGGKS